MELCVAKETRALTALGGARTADLPGLVVASGPAAEFAWEEFLSGYVAAAGIGSLPADSPLFRSAIRRTGRLTDSGMTADDMSRMVKRRMRKAGLPSRLSPHSFRVATITDLLAQGVPLEDVQQLAGHADPRTTRLYDRRQRRVTRNIVERISI